MKTTTIECPECAGHGGEGVYCDECLSTGRLTVTGAAAEAIEELRAALAAAVARAEAAERELAAVPVEAIRRYFDHSDAYAAVQADTYEMHEGMNDCQQIAEWLGRRGEMQP